MLGTEYIVVAVVLRLAAGVSYLAMTWRGTARPNPVSWLCWGATPLVAFAAQIQDGVTSASWVTLSLGVGPLLVFAVSVGRNTAWRAGRTDMMCGGCAALGIVLWQVADNPGPALTLSILADILGSIPTLAKVYYEPHSEKASPYLMSLLGMVVTLLTLDGWEYFDYAFPLYMLLINLSIFGLIVTRSVQLRRPPPGPLEPPTTSPGWMRSTPSGGYRGGRTARFRRGLSDEVVFSSRYSCCGCADGSTVDELTRTRVSGGGTDGWGSGSCWGSQSGPVLLGFFIGSYICCPVASLIISRTRFSTRFPNRVGFPPLCWRIASSSAWDSRPMGWEYTSRW
ncbi:hypothetical protein AB1484_38135 [Parafrankia sp. FMc6]|uniref:hypothetical protein n=1 Tax=Parafrankia soli TaxID=2599596 RepID=UPI0034D472A6